VSHREEQTRTGKALGVSVAICCHNGEKRLPGTLAHLKNQRVVNSLKWEVIVIDNASTDRTAMVARQYWSDDGPAPLRVISEPQAGLSFARERAFKEANYEVVSFVDDDNWVCPNWVATASDCMTSEQQLGAVGSSNEVVSDTPLPQWFDRHKDSYAIWNYPKDATKSTWYLIGAGMTIRKSTWNWLKNHGFSSNLTGRLGAQLSSSEDVELGCAIRLAGWNIRIEPKLRLKHYMAPNRLHWTYLRRLKRKIGEADVVLDSYRLVHQGRQGGLTNRLRLCWWLRFAKEGLDLLVRIHARTILCAAREDMEDNDEVTELERRVGRLLGLLRLRSRYGQLRREIASAEWCRAEHLEEPPLTVDELTGIAFRGQLAPSARG
jgi:glycosyltransferase involved in cell wall biosynthesis